MKLLVNDIENLCNDYLGFIENSKYRENENFYTENSEIFELSYNENPFGPSPKALKVIDDFKNFVNLYPPVGYTLLRQKISSRLGIDENEVIIGNGSMGVINSAVRLFAGKNEKVIYSKSSIPMYKWTVLSNGSIPEIIPLREDYNHNFNAILGAVDAHTKVIIIDNPHNPTGLYMDAETVLNFINQVPQDILVIIDQAYIEYVPNLDEEKILKNIRSFPNLLITRTFSKIHALAGLRIGYGLANAKIIRALNAENLGNIGHINILSCFAASASLDDQEYLKQAKKKNRECIEEIESFFIKNQIAFLKSSTNFICYIVPSSKLEKKNLDIKNIKVTHGFMFGYDELIRMSFAAKMDFNLNLLTSQAIP